MGGGNEDANDELWHKEHEQCTLSNDVTFIDKENLRITLGLYHMRNRLGYVKERSSTSRFSAICKYNEQCGFAMRASTYGIVWKIHKWDAPYSC